MNVKKEGETIDELLSRMIKRERAIGNTWNTERKILIMGPANSGKSTIRKVFFENADPNSLLTDPLEPTRGVENYVYDWLDLKIGVADSSGQEIVSWFETRGDEVFPGTDAIIYVFDMSKWETNKDEILNQARMLLASRQEHAPEAKITFFIHKKDLVDAEKRTTMFHEIQDEINIGIHEAGFKEVPEYCNTSLVPEHALDIVRSMRNILFKYSAVLRRAMIPVALRE